MKKGNRRAKQTVDASTTDDYEKKFQQLELENQAYQVAPSLYFCFLYLFCFDFKGACLVAEKCLRKEKKIGILDLILFVWIAFAKVNICNGIDLATNFRLDSDFFSL